MKFARRPFTLMLLFLISISFAHAMTLEEYLAQVELGNQGVRGAKVGKDAKQLRSQEAKLFFKPSFFLSGEYSDDKRPTNAPSFQGIQTIRTNYRAGLAQNFRTGTKASISYNIYRTEINGANPGVLTRDTFVDVFPQLELSQSLWRNFMGLEFEANEKAQLSQVESARLTDQFTLKQLMIKAENAYWRLLLSEEALKVQKESLDRARKLRDWNASRLKTNLIDEADYLQTEANLQARELEYENALIDVDTARREFNTMRQSDGDVTLESFVVERNFLLTAKLPEKVPLREDVLISMENQKAIEANAALGVERNKPNLEVYGSTSFNGRDEAYGQAYQQSVSGTKPWTIVGLRFSTPLDFGSLSDYRKGYVQEKAAAELNYRRKSYEVDREWDVLSQRFDQFKRRLKLSKRMEEIQLKKFLSEKRRFGQGRTTTFQVIQFEQDYANAQLLSLRNEQELVIVYNQLKLFSGVSHE